MITNDKQGTIRTALPKTVAIDEVTAGNILDRLHARRAAILLVSAGAPLAAHQLDELEADIQALADGMTVARIEALARGVLR